MSSMDTNDGPRSGMGRQGGRGGGRYGGHNGRSGYDDRRYQGGNQFSSGGGRGGYGDGGGRFRGGPGKGRGYWGDRGRGPGRGRGYTHPNERGRGPGNRNFETPDDVEFVRMLKGHKQRVTAIVVDHQSQQLYTGSEDGTVRVWDCTSAQCTNNVNVGGQVDCLLLEGGFLFVGVLENGQGLIKVWNTSTGSQTILAGHTGQVLCLVAGNNALFSGGQDKTIRVWMYNTVSANFEPSAVLTSDRGGHKGPVQSLCIVQPYLFSGDWKGVLKVWDMNSGQCTQTLVGAHTGVIMGMLCYDNHLFTASLDGGVRIWQPLETPVPGAILESAPVYTHPPEDEDTENFVSGMAGNVRKRGDAPTNSAVLAMCGTTDHASRPVLLVSHDDDIIRLWELPNFVDRGLISGVRESRAMTVLPALGLIAAGERTGDVKLWKWKGM